MRKEIADLDLEAAFVFSFLSSKAASLGWAFYGLLDSAMGLLVT